MEKDRLHRKAFTSSSLLNYGTTQFGNCCAYCRSAADLMAINLEVEHIQPQAAGGLTRLDNLCLACPSCNRYKGSRQTAVDPDSGEIVSLFHPQKQIWIEHFSWINDASQIAGKTAIGRATMVALQVNRPALVAVRKLWVKLDRHPPN